LKPDLGPKAFFTEWLKIRATAGYWWRSKANMTQKFTNNHLFSKISSTCIASAATGDNRARRCEKFLFQGSHAVLKVLKKY